MSVTKLAKVDVFDRMEWDALLSGFEDATIYQTGAYGDGRWGEKRLSRILLGDDRDPICIAQVTVISLPLFRGGIAYIPWGPLWERKGEKPDPERFRFILQGLKDEYVVKRGLLLRILPAIREDLFPEASIILEEEGFTSTNATRYRTLILDLTPDIETIRKGFGRRWKGYLNQAEKSDFNIREGNEDELYGEFSDIYHTMMSRKQFQTSVDIEDFRKAQEVLPRQFKMRIVICEYENKPIAALVVSKIGNRGIYLLGATNTDVTRLKGSYLLHWRIIKWLKEQGAQYYDLGGIDPESNPGVYQFKRGMTEMEGYHIGQFEISPNRIVKKIVNAGEMVRKLLHRNAK
jgi:hypothetical protein